MRKRVSVVLLGFLAVASQTLQAAPSTQMHVSVEVVARTVFNVVSQPASVEITAADISRGFVEVPTAIAFRVRSNARNGYTVGFQPVGYPFTRAQVTWGTTTAVVADDSSWVAQPYQQGGTAGSMDVRLSLAPGTEPGSYAWPVQVSADSL